MAVNEPLICSSNCSEALIKVFSNSPSATVILVENEAESTTRFVTLVLNLVEKEPLSVFKFVILVENEAESVFLN